MKINKKIKGPLYGLITGLILVILSFIPYIKVIPLAVGIAVGWAWKNILIHTLRKYELWSPLSFYDNKTTTILMLIPLAIVIMTLLFSQKKQFKIIGVALSILLVCLTVIFWVGLYLFVPT